MEGYGSKFIYQKELAKIDNLAIEGLLGTEDSLGYKTEEIETHFHSCERWFGLAAAPSGETHRADRLASGMGAFEIDAGNDDWGSWVQIVGTLDLPTNSFIKYDLHRIFVIDSQRSQEYFIQIAFGNDTPAAALLALDYTEFLFKAPTVATSGVPLKIQSGTRSAGNKAWARGLVPGQVSGTLNFYFGIHEYPG